MLSDILSFFGVIVGAIEFIIAFLLNTTKALDIAIVYVVEAVSYILSIAPFVPSDLASVFFAMIILSVVFLIAGRQK